MIDLRQHIETIFDSYDAHTKYDPIVPTADDPDLFIYLCGEVSVYISDLAVTRKYAFAWLKFRKIAISFQSNGANEVVISFI